MATKKPSFTKIVIDDTNGLKVLSDFAADKNETVKITTSLCDVIRAALDWSPLDLSDCILIDGLTVTNFVTGEESASSADIIKQIKVDVIQAALDSGDEDKIEKLYLLLAGDYKHTPVCKANKKTATTTTDTSDKSNATEEKAHKLYTEEHEKVVAANLIEMIKTGESIPTNGDTNKEKGTFCINTGIKAKGATSATCKKITSLAFTKLTGKELESYKTRTKWELSKVQECHAELTAALRAKGYM